MNIHEAKEKIKIIRKNLLDIQSICSIINENSFIVDEFGYKEIEQGTSMEVEYPAENTQLQKYWLEIQKNVPSGFSIEGNLLRHLSFNQACDWFDIGHNDIPLELINVEEYEKQIVLIEYIDTLHPEVNRVSEIVLNGDIDGALKIIYTALDSKIRSFLNLNATESTVPAIGKAFKDNVFISPGSENTDAVRNFLQGIIGYYRNNIIHKNLSTSRNNINSSLSLFAIAHESFKLLDKCTKHIAR